MALTCERIEVPPNAFEVAARLWDRPGLALVRTNQGATSFVMCDPISLSNELDPEPELALAAAPHADAPRWLGLLPYESLRGIEGEFADSRAAPPISSPLWLRYPAVVRVGECTELISESEFAASALRRLLQRSPRPGAVSLSFLGDIEAGSLHAERVRRALVEIAQGNVYEVNLARRFELLVEGSALDLLAAFERGGAMPHSLALQHQGLGVVAVSPELCLALDPDGSLLTSPIKGTRPRHADPREDARLAAELDADPKERAELTMIIDVERNDLARVAELGSVHVSEPPHVLALPGVHHRLASVSARLRQGLSRRELFQEFLPSGSVTGAPKRRAMQLIRELEPHRRGLYTGAVGFIRHDGGVELKMAIRTLSVRDGVGHYFAGGGIVADSVPEREVEETLWKAERLLSLAGEKSS
ncbi:MAG: chorismate-binding protein [Myxococcota bacterium]